MYGLLRISRVMGYSVRDEIWAIKVISGGKKHESHSLFYSLGGNFDKVRDTWFQTLAFNHGSSFVLYRGVRGPY